MDWIKRNLLFVIGSAVALVLLIGAGWYLYSSVSRNNASLEALNEQYNQLNRLNRLNPHPGSEKVNNITAAQEQERQVRDFIRKVNRVFEPVPAIPDATNVNNALLAESLRRTLDRMQREAGSSGVQLPEKYAFSFTAIRPLLVFDQAGLTPLAVQLGEVKVICDVLFAAKINALDSIRRERVCTHDREAQQTSDYTDRASKTNDVAVLTPYEVTIRCFSSELGAVLAGFASSKHGLMVKAINVEPAVAGTMMDPSGMGGMVSPETMYAPRPVMPPPGFGRPIMEEGGMPPRTMAPTYAPPTAAPTTGTGTRGGLPVLLDEKQFKVTMLIEVVKVTAKK